MVVPAQVESADFQNWFLKVDCELCVTEVCYAVSAILKVNTINLQLEKGTISKDKKTKLHMKIIKIEILVLFDSIFVYINIPLFSCLMVSYRHEHIMPGARETFPSPHSRGWGGRWSCDGHTS